MILVLSVVALALFLVAAPSLFCPFFSDRSGFLARPPIRFFPVLEEGDDVVSSLESIEETGVVLT